MPPRARPALESRQAAGAHQAPQTQPAPGSRPTPHTRQAPRTQPAPGSHPTPHTRQAPQSLPRPQPRQAPGTRPTTPTRLTRRARALAGLVLAGALWTAFGLPSSDAAEPARPDQAEQVVVIRDGDTLWDLADSYAPAGVDRRSWVAEVVERNNIDPQRLQTGDVVRVPAP